MGVAIDSLRASLVLPRPLGRHPTSLWLSQLAAVRQNLCVIQKAALGGSGSEGKVGGDRPAEGRYGLLLEKVVMGYNESSGVSEHKSRHNACLC